MNMTAPCINCPDRQMHCHGKCERYAEFSRLNAEERHTRHQNSYKYTAAATVLIESAVKRRRKKHER